MAALHAVKDLWKLLKAGEVSLDLDVCEKLIKTLYDSIEKAPSHKKEVMLKTIAAAQKAFRLQKRSSGDVRWTAMLDQLTECDTKLQQKSEGDADEASAEHHNENGQQGPPSSVSQYLARLKGQKKELYKNPPVLPPINIHIEKEWVGLPKRDTKTGRLTFACGQDESLQAKLKDFHPNRSPEEVLRGGAFGGTYFRSIQSAVTNQVYKANEVLANSVKDEWIKGLDKKTYLSSQSYNLNVNKYKAKCGGSLGMWESSGWISDADPYGWFQWYCRFYQGRRCSDDVRQIARWAGVAGSKGRFKSQLCNKILNAGTTYDDASISPVIRQTLWHWGLEITPEVLESHRNK